MDITKYSKKMWIGVLVLAAISIAVDILILTNVIGAGDDAAKSTSRLGWGIGALGVFYGIRGVIYHIKKDKQSK